MLSGRRRLGGRQPRGGRWGTGPRRRSAGRCGVGRVGRSTRTGRGRCGCNGSGCDSNYRPWSRHLDGRGVDTTRGAREVVPRPCAIGWAAGHLGVRGVGIGLPREPGHHDAAQRMRTPVAAMVSAVRTSDRCSVRDMVGTIHDHWPIRGRDGGYVVVDPPRRDSPIAARRAGLGD